MKGDVVCGALDVIMKGDVVCGAVDASPAGSGDVREDVRVNPFIFKKNKNVLVMTLAFHINRVMTNLLSESACNEKLFEERFLSSILLEPVEGQSTKYAVAKRVMEEIVSNISNSPAAQVVLYRTLGSMSSGFSNRILQRLEEICADTYRTKVTLSLVSLVARRPREDQVLILTKP